MRPSWSYFGVLNSSGRELRYERPDDLQDLFMQPAIMGWPAVKLPCTYVGKVQAALPSVNHYALDEVLLRSSNYTT